MTKKTTPKKSSGKKADVKEETVASHQDVVENTDEVNAATPEEAKIPSLDDAPEETVESKQDEVKTTVDKSEEENIPGVDGVPAEAAPHTEKGDKISVTMNVSMAGRGYSYRPRQVVRLPKKRAEDWAKAAICTINM